MTDPFEAAHAVIDAQAAKANAQRPLQEQRYRDYLATFRSPEGARVLSDLEHRFGGRTLVPGDPTQTYARAAQAEVVHFIGRLLREADAHFDPKRFDAKKGTP